jgi:hypothetical protein
MGPVDHVVSDYFSPACGSANQLAVVRSFVQSIDIFNDSDPLCNG